MASTTTDDQFLMYVLNNVISEYELQMVLLEKRNGNTHPYKEN